jgi:hypothetical protein
MRPEHELPGVEDSYWHLDEALTELDLQERPSGPERYAVRFKAHIETSSYTPRKTIYLLGHSGTQVEITGKAYILVPEVTLTVGPFGHPVSSGGIGTVKGSEWHGMRHHEIGKARGLYFAEDRALAIWEVDSYGRLDDFTHGQLWQAFEGWLITRFPDATHIFTDDDEPGDNPAENREFLESLGYAPVAGGRRIFSREVVR